MSIDATEKKRCFGNKEGQGFYALYHDQEWGIPLHDDQKLFELLILEGAQAGLSWETILKKRASYKEAFYNFDVKKVSLMTDCQLEALTKNPQIVRNRLKIWSVRTNALSFLKIQNMYGSFDSYVWRFVDDTPIVNYWTSLSEIPTSTPISTSLSKSLKSYGMTFVGPTIMYAYMQAVGMVNDHLVDCWCRTDKPA